MIWLLAEKISNQREKRMMRSYDFRLVNVAGYIELKIAQSPGTNGIREKFVMFAVQTDQRTNRIEGVTKNSPYGPDCACNPEATVSKLVTAQVNLCLRMMM
jgi:hypothetical protein